MAEKEPPMFTNSRIKKIMKSSPDVENISLESIYLVSKATELFVIHLAQESATRIQSKTLDYDCVASAVEDDDRLEFLRDIIPQQITVKDFYKMNKQRVIDGDNG